MNPSLPLLPVGHFLMARPDLAASVVEWLAAQRCRASGLASDDARRRRQQRTTARKAMTLAAMQRTPLGLFWAFSSERLMCALDAKGALFVAYVPHVETARDAEMTNLMRRLVNVNAKWVE